MKIYTETLTMDDLESFAAQIPPLYVRGGHLVEGRKRRLEGVTLGADSAQRPTNWRELDASAQDRSALGGHRSMPQHATYDEHGRWMALVFDADPQARIKSVVNDFDGREDFHAQTNHKYAPSAAR